jgi:hypothetical protein
VPQVPSYEPFIRGSDIRLVAGSADVRASAGADGVRVDVNLDGITPDLVVGAGGGRRCLKHIPTTRRPSQRPARPWVPLCVTLCTVPAVLRQDSGFTMCELVRLLLRFGPDSGRPARSDARPGGPRPLQWRVRWPCPATAGRPGQAPQVC